MDMSFSQLARLCVAFHDQTAGDRTTRQAQQLLALSAGAADDAVEAAESAGYIRREDGGRLSLTERGTRLATLVAAAERSHAAKTEGLVTRPYADWLPSGEEDLTVA